jgi:uncharacterized protein YjiS (DUF1127 family)
MPAVLAVVVRGVGIHGGEGSSTASRPSKVPAPWTAIHKKLAAGPLLEASFGRRPRRRPKRSAAWLPRFFGCMARRRFSPDWGAFQERRKRQRLRATLYDLSDRELMDIGTTRGEIDYIALNRSIDPRRGIHQLRDAAIGLPRWSFSTSVKGAS